MDARALRGLEIAAKCKVVRGNGAWIVPSQSTVGSHYTVKPETQQCSCLDHETRNAKCKHLWAVDYVLQRDFGTAGKVTQTETLTVTQVTETYAQNWPAYNAAQTHEAEHFVRLLRDLCEGVPQPQQNFGRPRLPQSDLTFGVVFKVYSTMSCRRFMGDLQDAQDKALVAKAPSFTSISRYLETPTLTPILKALIEESASPLKAVEADFAVDSSGFSTTTYDRWFDHKYGKMRSEAKWIKTHIMVGVNTHVVTSVEATPTESADAPQFPVLVGRTAQNFAIKEVSADKAYSSKRNLRTVDALGGTAFIPFKSNARGGGGHHNYDGLWDKMWHYYSFNRSAFLEHYHKRSNVETAFSMIKGKFGGSVRSKTPTAQVNEVLAKVLCHNICVLIQSMYELGIEATFGTEVAVVPEVVLN